MDELRKKLIYMIENHCAIVVADACPESSNGKCTIRECATCLANHLIANGVTVQESKGVEIDQFNKWIPTSEPPKEPGEYIVAQKHWSDGHLETKKGKWNGVEWLVDGRESLMVTHWMPPSPLPEPPKGE